MNNKRRGFLAGAGIGLAGSLALTACGGSAAETHTAPVVVLVHGSQHGSFCWARVVPHLVLGGAIPLAVDLPGTGLSGRFPTNYYARPFDASAFAAEPSPVAGITLSDFATHVGDLVDKLHASGRGPIYLVGHSLAGLTLNAVAEAKASKLAGLIYLSAILPSAGQSLVDTLSYAEAAQSFVLQGKAGSVGLPTIGATRLDLMSPNPAYRAEVKAAYCHDVSDDDYLAWTNQMVPDDPEAVAVTPIPLTTAKFGSVPRCYIRCAQDRIVPPAWASRMVDAIDVFAPARRTVVRDLDSSHSSFLSRPAELAQLILSQLVV